MSPHSVAQTIEATLATLDREGAKLDKATHQALTNGIENARKVAKWRPEAEGDITSLAYAAVTEGREPFEDEAVNRAFLSEHIVNTRPRIVAHAGQILAGLVVEHFDSIVSALDEVYQRKVATPCRESHQALTAQGITAEDGPALVLSSGPEAAAAWAVMSAATAAHARLLNTYKALRASAGTGSSADPIFLWVDPAGHALNEVRQLAPAAKPWTVLEAGMDLGIATPAQAGDRQRAAAEEMERQSPARSDEQQLSEHAWMVHRIRARSA